MKNSDELNQILENLPFIIEGDNSADYNLSEDVSSIVYYVDIFECGNSDIISRHIDIDFIFGDCYELHEEDALFQAIFTRCNLQTITKASEQEIVLYQKP